MKPHGRSLAMNLRSAEESAVPETPVIKALVMWAD